MESDTWPRVTITAIDAARTQLDSAIDLWFAEGDAISIRTLAAASHHICHDICKARGISSPLLFNPKIWKDKTEAEEFKKYLLEAENFAKHAERDPRPEAELIFRPGMTEFYMIEGTHLFNAIGAALTDRMKIFRFRAELFYPGIFGGSSELSEEPFDIEMRGLSRPDFLKTCFENKPRGIRD